MTIHILVFTIILLFLLIYIFKIKKQNIFINSLLKNIGEGIYGVDKNGICIWINQKALDMLDFKKEEVIGIHQHYLFHHHTIENHEYLVEDCPIYKTINDKKTRNCHEYFMKKDGNFLPVALTVAVVNNYGAIVVFRDISDIKDYERKLQKEVLKKTEELQELNSNLENKIIDAIEQNKKQQALLEHQSRLAALGEMIGNIAHQWRQPLSVITTWISGFQIKHELGIAMSKEEVDAMTNSIINQANYLSKTIDDFRDFIKNENTKELFNLSKLTTDTVNLLNATLKSNEIEIILNLDQTLYYEGYPNQLSQVLINIINNAKDAFKEKSQDIKQIKIITIQNSNQIKIEIIDNAGGIDKEIKAKIFDPYFTTKHKSQGTGLGLYICANIIQKYFNGRINIQDMNETIKGFVYKGTKFIIEFEIKDTKK